MNKKIKLLSLLFLVLGVFKNSDGQVIAPDILSKQWNAFWIAVPNQPAKDYGVYEFRKNIALTAKPSSFIIHVSADNRYKLYVNGQLASLGPARGDFYHWNFETVDIASFLLVGDNLVSAVVWNYGDMKPEAQISFRTGFILQGNSANEEIINTGKSWKCRRDSSYRPLNPELIYSYYVAGPGESIDYNFSTGDWKKIKYDDNGWLAAQQLFNGLPKGMFGWSDGWMLVPRTIPPMELTPQRLTKSRKTQGIQLPDDFPASKRTVTVPANTNVTILLDQEFLTDAYPVLQFSKGKDAIITIGYAESLYINEEANKDWRTQNKKGNRNEIEGKHFVGVKDHLISNGQDLQEFCSLWWRTYRYMQLEIQTKNEALVLDDLYGIYTGYPFQMKAQFEAGDSKLSDIMKTGWRTARLDAMETYMDCPYYEQLQYVGDTRIQCLVSLFNSGDDRLMRNAITLLDDSRMAEGLTLSRYPTFTPQEIPPFSLWWIGMLHDYWIYRPDIDFVKSKLPGMRQVLWFFSKYQQADGSLKNLPYWNFSDWAETKGWNAGIPPIGKNGNSAILDLQLLWAYQLAAQLENALGMQEHSLEYQQASDKLKKTIQKKYWDTKRKLFADTPEKDLFSQHTNSLAILTGTIAGNEAKELAKKILSDTSLTEATIYFKYYTHQALTKAGLGNSYLQWLDIWKKNLESGMTTWAEISDINGTRSDCHAWGSSPNIEFFRIVLGIDSDAPGFKKIKIEPHLGALNQASGKMPHPDGEIQVDYIKENEKWKITISLPPNTPGRLLWKEKSYILKPGKTTLKF